MAEDLLDHMDPSGCLDKIVPLHATMFVGWEFRAKVGFIRSVWKVADVIRLVITGCSDFVEASAAS